MLNASEVAAMRAQLLIIPSSSPIFSAITFGPTGPQSVLAIWRKNLAFLGGN